MIAKILESFAAIVCVGIVCVQYQLQKLHRKCSSVCNISKILSPQKNPHLRYTAYWTGVDLGSGHFLHNIRMYASTVRNAYYAILLLHLN